MGARYREYIASGRKYQNITRKPAKESRVYISKSDLEKAFQDLDKIAKGYNDDWKKEIMGNAAQVVANAAKRRQRKRSRAAHYFYQSKGGDERSRVKILPGNLTQSIQYLRKLKKTPRAVIGPNIKNKITAKTIGKSERNSSGYYAQMVYGSAENFRREVMEPALAAVSAKVVQYVSKKLDQQTVKVKNQLSLFQ